MSNQWCTSQTTIGISDDGLTGPFQVAVERIKEFTEIKREPPEFIEPRPPASWPTKGEIKCESLSIRYAVRVILNDIRPAPVT